MLTTTPGDDSPAPAPPGRPPPARQPERKTAPATASRPKGRIFTKRQQGLKTAPPIQGVILRADLGPTPSPTLRRTVTRNRTHLRKRRGLMRKNTLISMARAEGTKRAKRPRVVKQRGGTVARRDQKTTKRKTSRGTWMMNSTSTSTNSYTTHLLTTHPPATYPPPW